MSPTSELELIEEIVGQESIESLHLICPRCIHEGWDWNTAMCGTHDESDVVEGREYQDCVVCFDYWEQRKCPRGHVLKQD